MSKILDQIFDDFESSVKDTKDLPHLDSLEINVFITKAITTLVSKVGDLNTKIKQLIPADLQAEIKSLEKEKSENMAAMKEILSKAKVAQSFKTDRFPVNYRRGTPSIDRLLLLKNGVTEKQIKDSTKPGVGSFSVKVD